MITLALSSYSLVQSVHDSMNSKSCPKYNSRQVGKCFETFGLDVTNSNFMLGSRFRDKMTKIVPARLTNTTKNSLSALETDSIITNRPVQKNEKSTYLDRSAKPNSGTRKFLCINVDISCEALINGYVYFSC